MKAVELKKILDVIVLKYPNADIEFAGEDIIIFKQANKEVFSIDIEEDTFRADIALLKEFLENSEKKTIAKNKTSKSKTSNNRLSNLDD